MKICAYVLNKHAKQTYAKECYDVRINAGMAVVIDILKRKLDIDVDFAGQATVQNYDVVLFSVTSDCDFWDFLAERHDWAPGNYRVVAGGQGVLNVRPFLPYIDYFVLGRAENVIDKLISGLRDYGEYDGPSVINSRTFNPDKKYSINQVSCIYPHSVALPNGDAYHEDVIGCNHKCLFCGYTWQRQHVKDEAFSYSGLWNGSKDRERAMIDMDNGIEVNLNKLRTTAIDGFSQRLRFAVNKHITRQMLRNFFTKIATCEHPHQVKIYNICGYPEETQNDWQEFLEDLTAADSLLPITQKQTSILLHSTPFRAMPATPLACKPMSYTNYRGKIAEVLGQGRYHGNIFYQGRSLWAVESMGTESLASVILSAIVWRGTEADSDNVMKIALSSKFWHANAKVRQLTLEKYFDVRKLFGSYDRESLPTKYLQSYANLSNLW